MTDSAALLADEVLPQKPLRQYVLSLPFALRFLFATDAEALTQVFGIAYRTISACVLKKTRLTRTSGATGAVTLIQRFGSALNLNIHFHMLVLDGAYLVGAESPVFRRGVRLRPAARPAPRSSRRGHVSASGRRHRCGGCRRV